MMYPPVVRIGYPTEPVPGMEYVCLVENHGWMILQWYEGPGWHREDVVYPGSNGLVDILPVYFGDIKCWMPQDGT